MTWSGDRFGAGDQTGGDYSAQSGGGHPHCPEVDYAVTHVYNESEEQTNGVIQALSIELEGGRLITNTYISPGTSRS